MRQLFIAIFIFGPAIAVSIVMGRFDLPYACIHIAVSTAAYLAIRQTVKNWRTESVLSRVADLVIVAFFFGVWLLWIVTIPTHSIVHKTLSLNNLQTELSGDSRFKHIRVNYTAQGNFLSVNGTIATETVYDELQMMITSRNSLDTDNVYVQISIESPPLKLKQWGWDIEQLAFPPKIAPD